MLTQERLKYRLTYDKVTGIFTTNITTPCNFKGKKSGHIDTNGYVILQLDGKLYKAHRLAYLYMEGKFPDKQLDHIDGNRSNNVYSNLRLATQSENSQNQRKAPSHNKYSGLLGAHYDTNTGNYRAKIKLEGIVYRLGTFKTAIEAHEAYLLAKQTLHPFNTLATA